MQLLSLDPNVLCFQSKGVFRFHILKFPGSGEAISSSELIGSGKKGTHIINNITIIVFRSYMCV